MLTYSNRKLSAVVERVYASRLLSWAAPTLASLLQRELAGMGSILDLGCGESSPVRHMPGSYLVGVDGDHRTVQLAAERGTHDEVVEGDLRSITFPAKSFDAVVLVEVIEHMSHEEGERLLEQALTWSRVKVVVTTPNGFWPQGALDGNLLQVHRCGWTIDELKSLGMRVRGLAGARVLRKENPGRSRNGVTPFAVTVRWWPWPVWLGVAAVTQVVSYRLPCVAFELFAVWERGPE
ncbi:MAG: class I SAM-dependent methyltransferase [Candidatus Dormibacteria bacterium]